MGLNILKGQDRAVEILKKSIKNKHLSHAYLFTGLEGVGKKTAALQMAQMLNCQNENKELGNSCGICASCKKIIAGSHPDIKLIKPEGNSIKIDQIRELKTKVYYKNTEAKYKIIIIDDAHQLTVEGSNSILKILEEPPQNTIFVLVTAKPQLLTDTIISRCQQIHFQALSGQLIVSCLKDKYADEQVNLAAALSGGSLRRAEELVQDKELLQRRKETIEILLETNHTTLADVLNWCEKWEKDRQAIKTILELCQFWYRDVLVWRTAEKEELLINKDFIKEIKKENYTVKKINKILSLLQDSLRMIDYNVNARFVLEVFFLKLKLKYS